MSDPLQVTAAVLSCIEVGVRLCNGIATIASEAKNADATVTALSSQVQTLNRTLEQLSQVCDLHRGSSDQNVRNIGRVIRQSIESCQTTLKSYADEVDLLAKDQKRGHAFLRGIKQAFKIKRADPTMSRYESGIQTNLLAIQTNMSTLQFYTGYTPAHEPRKVFAAASTHLSVHGQAMAPYRQRRHTLAQLETIAVQGQTQTQPAMVLLGEDEERALETLRHAVEIGQDVLHNARQDPTTHSEALAATADKGDFRTVLTAVGNGADPNSCKPDGLTLLMIAVQHDQSAAIDFLLQTKGIDVNLRDIEGWTALHHAAQCAHHDIIRKLIKAGLDVDAPCVQTGETAFQMAAKIGEPMRHVLEILREHGADANKQDKYSNTALSIAVRDNAYWRVEYLINTCGAVWSGEKSALAPASTKKEIVRLIDRQQQRRHSLATG